MWARLWSWWQKEPQPAAQEQREALLELLLLGMYMDQRLSVAETDALHDKLLDMPWESGMALSIYLQSIMPKIRTAYENMAARRQLLQSIRDRLATPEARREAYEKLRKFLAVDGVAAGEQEFLTQVRAVLGL